MKITTLERFMRHVEIDPITGCWLWRAHIIQAGYGQFRYEGRLHVAHRVAWMLFVDEDLHDEMDIHHTCRVRSCVNWQHLEQILYYEHLAKHAAERKQMIT